MSVPSMSLIIVAYNNVPFLRRTFEGLCRQSYQDFEILLADDGSGSEVADFVDEMRQRGMHIRHFWQPDMGFRKCRILNHVVINTSADYLVVLDADCVPHRHFIRNHMMQRLSNTFLVGRRVELGPVLTDLLGDSAERLFSIETWPCLLWYKAVYPHCPKTRHLEVGLYLSPRLIRIHGRSKGLLGCNFSCWKSDLVAVNGFNERFETTGGGEDTDVERRFLIKGLSPINVKHACICFHQYHELLVRAPEGMNLCKALSEENSPTAEPGISTHTGEDIIER